MNIIGNDIYITQGESFTLGFDIVNKDGSPYILSNALRNPYMLITISSNNYEQDKRYIANYWLDLSHLPKFENTRAIDASNLDRYPPADLSYDDDFINDTSGRIAVFKSGDNYKYYEPTKAAYVDYSLKVFIPFDTSMTSDLVERNYLYSVKIVSGDLTGDAVKNAYSMAYGVVPDVNTSDMEQIEKLYNRLIIDSKDLLKNIHLDCPLSNIDVSNVVIKHGDLVVNNDLIGGQL